MIIPFPHTHKLSDVSTNYHRTNYGKFCVLNRLIMTRNQFQHIDIFNMKGKLRLKDSKWNFTVFVCFFFLFFLMFCVFNASLLCLFTVDSFKSAQLRNRCCVDFSWCCCMSPIACTRELGLKVGCPPWGVYLRNLSSYLSEFRKKPQKTPNGLAHKGDRRLNLAPPAYQF